MIAAMLLAVATPASAIDAERAFAADAQKLGQWTAFRKWSTPEAVMFAPQPVNAHAYLKDAGDPPAALNWSPAESYVSCDGLVAVNTGPWSTPDRTRFGFFTTVWQRNGETWRWLYDGGDALKSPRAEAAEPLERRASCDGTPAGATQLATDNGPDGSNGAGRSQDGTLAWSWAVGQNGDRRFVAQLWNGTSFDTVVDDRVAAPAQ